MSSFTGSSSTMRGKFEMDRAVNLMFWRDIPTPLPEGDSVERYFRGAAFSD